jgi:hypothetical protein
MHTPRLITILALLGLLLGGTLAQTPPARADGGTTGEACFQETGFCVRGRFLAYWTANGGLAINGYPLSNERQELLEDGTTYTVQYFERVRLEYHPENPAPWDVELGQFGRRVLNSLGVPVNPNPSEPRAGYTFFPVTGHNVSPRFLDYWLANGGLAQFGYPLTEESAGIPLVEEGTGRVLTYDGVVQYFERARFEYHPENAGTPYAILLGQFGRQILGQVDALRGNPDFFTTYTTNVTLQQQLGAPTGTAFQSPGATQPFQGGRMYYLEQGGTLFPIPATDPPTRKVIYALCGDAQGGQWIPALDTWAPGQPAGGGAGPTPGLYEPKLGFYQVWTQYPDARACLGYATTPDSQALPLTAQAFQRGALLLSDTTEGRFIYALTYGTTSNGAYAPGSGRYQRFPAPAR